MQKRKQYEPRRQSKRNTARYLYEQIKSDLKAAVRGAYGYDDRDFLAFEPFKFLTYLQLMSCQKSLQGK